MTPAVAYLAIIIVTTILGYIWGNNLGAVLGFITGDVLCFAMKSLARKHLRQTTFIVEKERYRMAALFQMQNKELVEKVFKTNDLALAGMSVANSIETICRNAWMLAPNKPRDAWQSPIWLNAAVSKMMKDTTNKNLTLYLVKLEKHLVKEMFDIKS